ncbi:MAG TPA: tetratricopeptide repeat protein [Chitinolyticbacter sp.]|uniref:tetratricopeptide repeat protein n=1 Tax=Chitinolyticbacter albus TaxID=2961951 RepID=UPI00210999AA|nr:tetratricopeptide repeat protein [Chitinolyticbacter albus]HSC79662.1 tetratricopeptide repeat protein [Chitinolyticbacter sp.]
MTILPAILHEQITTLLDEGDKHFEKGRDEQALAKYREAEALLPTERERFEASTIVLTAIGDTLFQLRDFSAASDTLILALRCPDGEGNPFIHLRLGQCALELGNEARAADQLGQAFESGGLDVFEDEDAHYLAFLKERVGLVL